MAYTGGNLALVSSVNGTGVYIYKSDSDTRATVAASGYFNNTDDDLNLAADDLIFVVGDEGHYALRVDTVAAGVVTTESGMGETQWLSAQLADVSAASSVYIAAPCDGKIGRFKTILQGAITTADAAVKLQIGGTDVTGASVTVANSGSAAGDVDEATATAANAVTEGQAVEIESDGGSSTTAILVAMVEFIPA